MSASQTGDRVAVSAYGYFAPDGSYCITDPRTPRPWTNIISNPRLGLAVSQTGSGFTWIENSQLAVITGWQQDLCRDASGKFLYAQDLDTGALWSLSPAPVWARGAIHECRHALGSTELRTAFEGIEASWTLFCDPTEPVELWLVRIVNRSGRARALALTPYFEWCCGVAPAPRREFNKLFLETRFDRPRGAVFATNHLWDVPSERFGHWNTTFPFVAAFATTGTVAAAEGDKAAFLGRYGSTRAPAALGAERWPGSFGRHGDPVAALRVPVGLSIGEERTLGFVLAVEGSREAATALVERFARIESIEASLASARAAWRERFAAHRIATGEPTLDLLANDWLRYQAVSARLWGRCGYYQQSGAFGFRDQLQDSLVWLTIDPPRTRAQIGLHAAHQFADGSVYHWWHPLSEQGLRTRMSDDLLWLAFVTAAYIRETGDLGLLADRSPFVDDREPRPLIDHVDRAFEHVFARTSARGLPFIGAGDWNDGLSAVGLEERGESVWLAHFLAGLLADWAEIHRRHGAPARAAELAARREALVAAINAHAWDGGWYQRGTLDDGTPFGSQHNRVGRIFLNAQTWAVLNDVAPPDRAAQCMDAVKRHLVSSAGALLLAPAYDAPVPEIGYITRYAPGLRENGGVYTHAATWAIAAACKMKDADLVGRLLAAINPALKDPERYWAEPYVLPGNVDGPDSPYHGRGGWTWYTGSAAWLHRVVSEWVLGIRPDWDGLLLDPCLPPGWNGARMTRPHRGSIYQIRIERGGVPSPIAFLDGERLPQPSVPAAAAGGTHEVVIRCP